MFIPKIPSMKMTDLVAALAPDCRIETIGIRPGEKLHESLLGEDEARSTLEFDDLFVIEPLHPWWGGHLSGGRKLPDGFHYASDNNSHWLTVDELGRLASEAPDAE